MIDRIERVIARWTARRHRAGAHGIIDVSVTSYADTGKRQPHLELGEDAKETP